MEAVRYSAEILKDMPERFWNCEIWTMFVSDEDRHLLFTLKFLAEKAPSETLKRYDPVLATAGAATS